ncbi:MAG: Uma2 family endonuclease [Cyanosarcina radialis HA8281-LM2]|nr:Uma2 family endonuclease [Cyanosarcina radialis HA8281-LM2]
MGYFYRFFLNIQHFWEHGIEPDNCFYIQNHQRMRGKTRIDLTVDPPPDLAIEVRSQIL